MKLLWLTNIPSPYRVEFFNELGKLCNLTVLFEKEESDERDKSWKKFNSDHFRPVFLEGSKVGVAEAFCPDIIKYLRKNTYDHIIVTNFSDPTGILAIAYMKLKKIPYIIESDGGFAKNRNGFKEKLKKWLLSSAKLYFSTAEEHDRYYMTYGAQKDEIVRYPFSSLHNSDILSAPVSFWEKKEIRQNLGITEEKVILAVGQFIYRKGYDILFDALSKIKTPSVGCYIVGGEPTKEYQKMVIEKKLENVHFISFKTKLELEEYYKSADIFVHPTREDIWGLVINEAMAKGLSVVTTNKCIAGLELIGDRPLGQIVPSENSILLAEAMDRELRMTSISKSVAILERIKRYSVEQMAAVHIAILENKTNEEK